MGSYPDIDPFDHGTAYKRATDGHISNASISGMDLQRTLPRQVSTGSLRGTQTVGYGNTKIDGTNNTITIENPVDGTTIGMGAIPDSSGQYGFFSLDAEGNLVMKIVNGTMFVFDPDTGKNSFQAGLLPDGTGGVAGANEGFDVSEGF